MPEPVRTDGETFAAFKDSFFYGSRSDLFFKFLHALGPQEAAAFLQELLRLTGEAADTGDAAPLAEHVYRQQVRAYERETERGASSRWVYEDAPWRPLARPVAEARLALLTSSGHFVEGDDPRPFGVEAMTQEEAQHRIVEFLQAAPELSHVPVDTPPERLRVRHGGYDVRAARRDPDVAFPLHRLRELEAEGRVGELAGAWSFVGAASQLRVRKDCAPAWAAMLRERGVEAALLVPV